MAAVVPLAAPPAAATLPGSYDNPVSPLDTPDSDVVRWGDVYYAFSTGDGFDNIPVMSTTDLSSWPQTLLFDPDVSDALPCQTGSVLGGDCRISAWATRAPGNGSPWAPSVIAVGNTYYLFYAAWDPSLAHYCVGVAVSTDPRGPYVDSSSAPVVCQPTLGGSIDPDAYQDAAGSYYLAWKNNDGSSTTPATLWASPLVFTGDGAQLEGATTALLTQNRPWETTIEQPFMALLGGRWLLFFSGGPWQTSAYAIAYAFCQGPTGPCADPNTTPVFGSAGAVAGPGAPSLFTDTSGTLWMAYNAWTTGTVGYPDGARSLRLDPLCLVGGTPLLQEPTATPQSLAPACPTGLPDGYQLAGADGGIFSFHTAFDGSVGGQRLQAPVVGLAADPSGGYWEVGADGGIFAFGAPFDGSLSGWTLRAPIVGMAATPDGGGYWEVDSQGHVASFGDAVDEGSIGGHLLDAPVVAMAADPAGGGYWEVAADGGIFAFGDAGFYGSMGGQRLDAPVVGIAPTPDGGGYWEVAADGGVFAFGDAAFYGSTGGRHLDAPVVGIAPTPDGGGYWEVAADGGIFAFGDAGFYGSMGGQRLGAPVVGIARIGT